MTNDTPKPLTREELLRLGAAVVNGDEDVLEAFGHAMRHLAALLPAEGLPPIDKDDERTVDALVAARTGQARRMVTHHCPDCAHHVQERDAAIARAEKAEAALAKINAIRDSIIGAQNINWSEHIYPLVAALNEAGFQGTPHKVARENLGTLIEQVKAAEARAEAAEKRVAELEGR